MQATVRSFDAATGSGSVFLDDGTVVEFGPEAFAGSGLRLLRPGQRVAIRCDPGGAITGLTLATFPLAGLAGQNVQPGAAGGNARPGTAADAPGIPG
jgi:cold shock CspA family protein